LLVLKRLSLRANQIEENQEVNHTNDPNQHGLHSLHHLEMQSRTERGQYIYLSILVSRIVSEKDGLRNRHMSMQKVQLFDWFWYRFLQLRICRKKGSLKQKPDLSANHKEHHKDFLCQRNLDRGNNQEHEQDWGL
jgi:hypothetical protein